MRAYIAALTASVLLLAGCASQEGLQVVSMEPAVPTSSWKTEAPPMEAVPAEDFEKGVQVYWHPQGTYADIATAASRVVSYVANLGANAIGITMPLYADSVMSTAVYPGIDTPTPEYLGVIVDEARSRGLRVQVRLLIDDESLKTAEQPDAWRGELTPVNSAEWFARYADLAAGYVPVLVDKHVDEYVVGVELKALQAYPAEWQTLTDRLRAEGYGGTISYAFNWSDWTAGMPFDSVGIDAYPNVDLPDEATTEQLVTALAGWIDGLDATVRRHVTFQEVGIAALSGNYFHPWEWGGEYANEPLNLELQSKWFDAVCVAAKNNGVRGIYYWMVDANDTTMLSPEAAATAPPKSFIGRPAENAIRQCFLD